MNIPDRQQRHEALNAGTSFICEAPAGSGKTELLIQRFLVLLANVQRPEEILAITFTRKATGEMRERILLALQLARGKKPEESHRQLTWQLAQAVLRADEALGWQLTQNPNRLQIKTFDSLCTSLTRQLPLESAFGSQPQICEDANELYRAAVHSLLNTLEDDCPWAESLATILNFLDNRFDRVEMLMTQLLAKREQWLPLISHATLGEHIRGQLGEHFETVINETVARLHQLIPNALQTELTGLAGYAAYNLRDSEKPSAISGCFNMDVEPRSLPDASPQGVKQWLGLWELLKTQKGEWRKNVTVAVGFPPGKGAEKKACDARKKQFKALLQQLQQIAGLDDALNDLQTLPGSAVDEQQWQLLQALFSVLPVLTAQLTLVFTEQNQVDFTEMSLAARRALGSADEPSQLALKMDYRLSHILVDEFQDTSAGQIELLNQLTAGWQPGDARTLFCVGDAMQSIYAFRGANVGLFLSAREAGLANVALTPLRLTANFRSQGGIVNWVNRTFARAFPEQSNISHGAVSYSPSDAIHPEAAQEAVVVHGFLEDPEGMSEAREVLDIINRTRAEKPAATIAVLVRSRRALSAIVPTLRQHGIRYRAVDLEPLGETPEVQDLMSLSRALLHPADRVAWLSVLRAPWCGLSLSDLHTIANQQNASGRLLPTLLEQCDMCLEGELLSEAGHGRLRRVLPILQLARREQMRKPLRDWVEGTWLALGGAACLPNEEALQNTRMFMELLETWEYPGDLPSLRILRKAVAELYAAPDPKADDRLQIMTIHKSKGLQFDTVIVPGLARRGNNRSDELLLWHERIALNGEAQLLIAPLTKISGQERHPNYQHLVAESGKKAALESCRLLYVACTRAERELHLCCSAVENSKSQGELRAPPAGSLLAGIWPSIAQQVRRYEAPAELAAPPPTTAADTIKRLCEEWQPPVLTRSNPLSRYIPPYEYDEAMNRADMSWQEPSLRHTGTLVHRYLQRITEQGVTGWSEARITGLRGAIALELQELGVTQGHISTASDAVITQLLQVLADTRGRSLLSCDYPFHRCEFAVTAATPQGYKEFVMDRVYTTDAGDTWVVDYKTALPESEQSRSVFLAQQRALYQPKMMTYCKVLRQAGFREVRAALYFTGIAEWLELTEV